MQKCKKIKVNKNKNQQQQDKMGSRNLVTVSCEFWKKKIKVTENLARNTLHYFVDYIRLEIEFFSLVFWPHGCRI